MKTSCSSFPFTSPFSNSRKFGTKPLPGLTYLESRKRAAYHWTCLGALGGLAAAPNTLRAGQTHTARYRGLAMDVRRLREPETYVVCVRGSDLSAKGCGPSLNEALLTERGFIAILHIPLYIHLWSFLCYSTLHCVLSCGKPEVTLLFSLTLLASSSRCLQVSLVKIVTVLT